MQRKYFCCVACSLNLHIPCRIPKLSYIRYLFFYEFQNSNKMQDATSNDLQVATPFFSLNCNDIQNLTKYINISDPKTSRKPLNFEKCNIFPVLTLNIKIGSKKISKNNFLYRNPRFSI